MQLHMGPGRSGAHRAHYMAAIAARACERSEAGAERGAERSGHISFRAESAFLKIPLRSLNTLSAARSYLLVPESVE